MIPIKAGPVAIGDHDGRHDHFHYAMGKNNKMASIKAIASAIILGISTLVPIGAAQAAPLSVPVVAGERHTDATDIRWRRGCGARRCGRVWVGRRPYFVRPRVYIVRPPVIVIAPVVRGGWKAHVRWCYNHHRFYNARTNRFVGRDGRRHVCVSPYRG